MLNKKITQKIYPIKNDIELRCTGRKDCKQFLLH